MRITPHARCRARLAGVLLLLGAAAAQAQPDHFRVVELEQEVRELAREVRAQAQRLAALERTSADRGQGQRSAARAPAADASPDAPWLDATNWARVQPGMRELDVIERLGPPTTARPDGNAMVMFYARELGSAAFLGGSVRLQDSRVVEVRPPTLQ